MARCSRHPTKAKSWWFTTIKVGLCQEDLTKRCSLLVRVLPIWCSQKMEILIRTCSRLLGRCSTITVVYLQKPTQSKHIFRESTTKTITWAEQVSTLASKISHRMSKSWNKEARSSSCLTLTVKTADTVLMSSRNFLSSRKKTEISNPPYTASVCLSITMPHSWMTLPSQDLTKAISFTSILLSITLRSYWLKLFKTLSEWPFRWLWVKSSKLAERWRVLKRFAITKILRSSVLMKTGLTWRSLVQCCWNPWNWKRAPILYFSCQKMLNWSSKSKTSQNWMQVRFLKKKCFNRRLIASTRKFLILSSKFRARIKVSIKHKRLQDLKRSMPPLMTSISIAWALKATKLSRNRSWPVSKIAEKDLAVSSLNLEMSRISLICLTQ